MIHKNKDGCISVSTQLEQLHPCSFQLISGDSMKHPFEKLIRGELAAIILAILVSLFALLKGYALLFLFTLYLLVFSLVCDSMLATYAKQSAHAAKQLTRAVLLFIIATCLLLQL